MADRLTIETRGKSSVLICQHCSKPFLEITEGEIRFQNKHGNSKHENRLSLEQLRTVMFELYRQSHPPDGWTF